jgi:flagellar motility protein MotE (MotC chaperone)
MESKIRAKKSPEISPIPQESVSQQRRVGTMGWADEMRNLAHETVSSFDARVATSAALRQRVAAVKQETAANLQAFQQELRTIRQELTRRAADLKRFLGQAAASRLRDFGAMHQGIRACLEAIRARREERHGEVAGLLAGFRQEREAAARHWRSMAATMLNRRASAAR